MGMATSMEKASAAKDTSSKAPTVGWRPELPQQPGRDFAGIRDGDVRG